MLCYGAQTPNFLRQWISESKFQISRKYEARSQKRLITIEKRRDDSKIDDLKQESE